MEEKRVFFQEQPALSGFLLYAIALLLSFLTFDSYLLMILSGMSSVIIYTLCCRNSRFILPVIIFSVMFIATPIVAQALEDVYNPTWDYVLSGAVLSALAMWFAAAVKLFRLRCKSKSECDYTVKGALLRGIGLLLIFPLPLLLTYAVFFTNIYALFNVTLVISLFGMIVGACLSLLCYCFFYTRGQFYIPPIVVSIGVAVSIFPLYGIEISMFFGGGFRLGFWNWLLSLPFVAGMWIAAVVKDTKRKPHTISYTEYETANAASAETITTTGINDEKTEQE